MSTPPTWYELLGVAPDASPEQIKAAWRDATDKFEPGSGTSQFRLFNEAADVLLNPEKRAAYDASLTSPPAPEVDEAPAASPAQTAETPEPPPVPVPEAPAATLEAPGVQAADDTALARLGGSLGWVALICAPLLIAAVVIALLVRHNYDQKVGTWNAGKEASAAAERALNSVLSYDYRHMEADRLRAVGFLTPAYGTKFSKTFSLLTTGPHGSVGPAVKTQTVVTANVLDTGVVDATESKVDVIAFVNQTSVKPGKTPAIFQNRVVVTMVHSGDAWLISDVKTY